MLLQVERRRFDAERHTMRHLQGQGRLRLEASDIFITHVCGSRDHINIEHVHSGYSLPKRDLIHRDRVHFQLELGSGPSTTKPHRLDSLKVVVETQNKTSLVLV